MGIIGTILSGGLNKIVGSIGNVIDSVHTSDEERAKLETAKMQIELEARRAMVEINMEMEKAYMADMDSLREQIKVELQSTDPFVRRSRPAFLWIMYLVIIYNFILQSILSMFNVAIKTIELPTDLWVVFGTGYLGYAYFRSKDKQPVGTTTGG